MTKSPQQKMQRYFSVWQDEGPQMGLRVLSAKMRWAVLQKKYNKGLYRHHIKALDKPMYLDLGDDGLSKTLYYRGVHEPPVTQWIKKELDPEMTILDIGANIGYYVLLESSVLNQNGSLYAIEPVPSTYGILQKNIALNQLSNVTTYQYAVGSAPGEAMIEVTEKRNWSHIAHSNLSAKRANLISDATYQSVPVPMTTVDLFVQEQQIENVNFIRMDVEGFETEIIKGAIHTLTNHRPLKVFMEVHPFFAEDPTPFAEMVSTIYSCGLHAKFIGHYTGEAIYQPTQEEVINFLFRKDFKEAPHLLFES